MRIITILILLLPAISISVYNCAESQDYTLNFTYINGTADHTTKASLCHDTQSLYIRWSSIDNEVIAPYAKCNDPLYNADAVEVFIATPVSYPNHYYELEVSPNSLLFFADITNPTGNCAALSSIYEDCGAATYGASISPQGWDAWLQIRLDLIGRGQPLTQFKINLLRIDVSSTAETRYLTWQPTFANPPCFHVPSYFQMITLV